MKNPKIGHNILWRHYRVRSRTLAYLIFITDILGIIINLLKHKKRMNTKNILVIRLEHIGDIVLTTTFIDNLRKNYPKSKITLLCRETTKTVAQMINGVDNIITLNTPWSSRDEQITSTRNILLFLKSNYKKFDLAFDLAFDPRNIILAKIMSKFSIGMGVRGAGFMLDKEVKWTSKTKHIVSRQLDLLRSIKLQVLEKNKKLSLNRNNLQKFRQTNKLPKRYTLVQISAGDKFREWPIKNWVKILNKLTKTQKVICCERDKTIVSKLKNSVKNKNLIFKELSLEEYIYLIHESERVISVESSAIHLASNFNKQVIDIHSRQTLAAEWGPYKNNKAKIIKPSHSEQPCRLNNCNHNLPEQCMSIITPKEVLNEFN